MTRVATPGSMGASVWARALSRTATIAANPERTLPQIIEELADASGDAPALLSDGESFSYRTLAGRAARYSRWALEQGIAQGDVVGLLMPNRPEYMAIWLGITRVGGVVALINTNLTGQSLASAVNTAAPAHLIVAAGLVERVKVVEHQLADAPTIWVHGDGDDRFPRIDRIVDRLPGDALRDHERRRVTIDDRALYIYTSGTTGASKAAIVTHARILQWSHWFAGLMNTGPDDRMYNCLPMYHSVGGVLATGALLVAGGSVVIRDTFSARQFWHDVVRWDCTLFQYIGELCRYLLQTDAHQRRNATPNPAVLRQRPAAGHLGRLQGAVSNPADSGVLRLDRGERVAGQRGRRARLGRPRPAIPGISIRGRARQVRRRREPARARCARLLCSMCASRGGRSDRQARRATRACGHPVRGLYQPGRLGHENRARRLRAWRRVGPNGRPAAAGRARLLLLRGSGRRYLPLEGRERGDVGGRRRHLRLSRHQGRNGLWRRDSRKRWTRRDGGRRHRRTPGSSGASVAPHRPAARLRASGLPAPSPRPAGHHDLQAYEAIARARGMRIRVRPATHSISTIATASNSFPSTRRCTTVSGAERWPSGAAIGSRTINRREPRRTA